MQHKISKLLESPKQMNTAPRVYKFLKAQEGRDPKQVLELHEYFAAEADPKFIVHEESSRSYLAFDSYEHFQVWFEANPGRRTLHEVIRGCQAQKLKFDLDAPADKLEKMPEVAYPAKPVYVGMGDELYDEVLLDMYNEEMVKYNAQVEQLNSMTPLRRKGRRVFLEFLVSLKACFEEVYGIDLAIKALAISDSSDETKYSKHIVIPDYHVKNHHEAAYFTTRLAACLPEDMIEFIDLGVNKSTQNFRLPGCHKVDSARVKKMRNGTTEQMIVTLTAGTCALESYHIYAKPDAPELVEHSADQVLAMVGPYTEGMEFQKSVGNLYLYRRMAPSHCHLCDRVHDSDNTLFATVSKQKCVKIHCRHAPGIAKTVGWLEGAKPAQGVFGEEIIPKQLNPMAGIPKEFSLETYCQPGLKDFRFHGDKYDTLLIKSPMGTGKTKKLLEYLADVPDTVHLIFISFRRSFSTELRNKLGKRVVDYRDVKGEIVSPRVIVQFESLHRLKLPVGKQSMLFLDESESIINQMENKQMAGAGTLRSCWEKFEWLMTNSTKVVAMDALADYRTYTLLRKTRKNVHMHLNTYTRPAEEAPVDYHYDSHEEWLNQVYLAGAAAQREPIVIVSTAKRQSDAIELHIRHTCPEARIKSYSSDSTEQDRLDFNDVNKAWADVDVLIYTSTVSAGCSFELARFKRVFAYFSDQSCDYKTAIQMLGRVRNIESREYHIYIKWSASDLPDSVKAIERAVATRAELGNILCNPLGLPKMINASGEYEYPLRDLYYHLHIGNIVHRCQSRNWFRNLFQQARASSGVVIKKKAGQLDEQKAKKIKEGNKVAIKAITAEENKQIANAPGLRDEEAMSLCREEILSIEERKSVAKFKLAECYRVPQDMITEEFVEKYNKPKVKAVFRNLNSCKMSTESLEDAVKVWRQSREQKETSVEDLASNDNMLKCMFAVDMLNTLMPSAQGDGRYCREACNFQERFVSRAVLEAQLDSAITQLRAHTDTVSLMFGVRRDAIRAEKADLKQKLGLVNSVIKGAYGLSIVGVKEKGPSSMFKLSPPKMFRWVPEDGRYEVTM